MGDWLLNSEEKVVKKRNGFIFLNRGQEVFSDTFSLEVNTSSNTTRLVILFG
jgi:hypothetical protein